MKPGGRSNAAADDFSTFLFRDFKEKRLEILKYLVIQGPAIQNYLVLTDKIVKSVIGVINSNFGGHAKENRLGR